jgi:hypothetical protein
MKEDQRKADRKNTSQISLKDADRQLPGSRSGASMTHFSLPPDVPKPHRED